MWHTISQVPLYIHIQTCKICNMYLYMAHRHASDSTWKLLFTCLWPSGSHKQAWKPWLWNSPCTGKKLRPWKQESCWLSGKGLRTGMGARFVSLRRCSPRQHSHQPINQAHGICQNQRKNSHVKRRKGWSADSSTSPSYTMVLFVTLFSFSFFLL